MGYEARAHIGIVVSGDSDELRSLITVATVDMCVASSDFNKACEDGERKPIRLFSDIDGNAFTTVDGYNSPLIIVDPQKLLDGISKSEYRRDVILVGVLKNTIDSFPYEVKKEESLKVVVRHY